MKIMKPFILFLIILALGVSTNSVYGINILLNGDFSSGLSGWSINNPSGHGLGTALFDIDGSGSLSSSQAFWVRTGGGYGTSPVDLWQMLSLNAGMTYTFSADIASTTMGSNYSGGELTATIGSTTLDGYDFGIIYSGIPEYATLSGTFTAPTTGLYQFNVNFFRPFISTNNTPTNYIDNAVFDSPYVIPEPSTWLLLGSGFLGIGLVGWFRKRKA